MIASSSRPIPNTVPTLPLGDHPAVSAKWVETSPVRGLRPSRHVHGDVRLGWRASAAHTSIEVTLLVGWREEGCNSGGRLAFHDWPAVVFDTWGHTYRHGSEQSLVLRTYDDDHDDVACPA